MSKVCNIYAGKAPTCQDYLYLHFCLVRYVIVKVVRKDHLDQLPVPSRIKSYLNTPFYYSEQVVATPDTDVFIECDMSCLPLGDR